MKKFIDSFGLELCAIENLPGDHMHPITHATPARDAQLAKVCTSIENMGKIGIPILGYYFSLAGVSGHWRAYESGGGRGGAGLKSFDYALVKDAPPIVDEPVSVAEMWERLAYFLERVVPVAENAGVKLAAHQDDPPAETLFGTGRLLTNHDAMQQLIDLVPSPSNGLEFCQGTVAEMGPDETISAVRRFAAQGKIFYVHFPQCARRLPQVRRGLYRRGRRQYDRRAQSLSRRRLRRGHHARPHAPRNRRRAVRTPGPRLRPRVHSRRNASAGIAGLVGRE